MSKLSLLIRSFLQLFLSKLSLLIRKKSDKQTEFYQTSVCLSEKYMVSNLSFAKTRFAYQKLFLISKLSFNRKSGKTLSNKQTEFWQNSVCLSETFSDKQTEFWHKNNKMFLISKLSFDKTPFAYQKLFLISKLIFDRKKRQNVV